MAGINAHRSYEQRIEYYYDALALCLESNSLLLKASLSIIAMYCADKPRFNIGDDVDYLHRKYFVKV